LVSQGYDVSGDGRTCPPSKYTRAEKNSTKTLL
jgi:hypothetical protein